MTENELTKLQRAALQAAAVRNDLTIFPVRSKPGLNAGSTAKLLKTLIAKGCAEERNAEGKTPVWRTTDDGRRLAVVVTDAGLAAIGMLPVGKKARSSGSSGNKGDVAANRAPMAGLSHDGPQMPRAGSKLAVLVDLLGRLEGATIEQMADATEWKHHSVRGVLSAMVVKKLGREIVSEKTCNGDRVYRLRP